MSGDSLHVVLGANGGAGRAIVRALAARGQRVRAVSRSNRVNFPDAIERVNGDVADASFTRAACQGAAVVYDCVNVPYADWLTTLPRILEAVIAGAPNADLVYIDNLYAYGKVNGALTETTPYHPVGRKGALRAQLANKLMAAHREGRARAAIARGSDFYGDGANSVVSL